MTVIVDNGLPGRVIEVKPARHVIREKEIVIKEGRHEKECSGAASPDAESTA
jgi:hypothetical protein